MRSFIPSPDNRDFLKKHRNKSAAINAALTLAGELTDQEKDLAGLAREIQKSIPAKWSAIGIKFFRNFILAGGDSALAKKISALKKEQIWALYFLVLQG